MSKEVLSYDDLQDPDEIPKTYEWGADLSRNILGMILTDRQFVIEATDLIQPNYFEEKPHRAFCSIVLNHFREWKSIPNKSIIIQKLKDNFKDEEDKLYHLTELDLCLEAYKPGLDSREYNLSIITAFAKKHAMMHAVNNMMKEIKKGDWTTDEAIGRIEAHYEKARTVNRRFVDSGENYFRDIDARYGRMTEEMETQEVFTTGFHRIDAALISGGIKKGEIGSIMALSGVGKSLVLTKAGWMNVLAKKRVLFLSTEMDEATIARRFDALFASHDIRRLIIEKDIVIPKVKRIGRNISEDGTQLGNYLLIKKFSQKTANTNTFRAYIHQLKMINWAPDLVILDYVGECKDYEEMTISDSRKRLVSEFRGLGYEEGFACLTAMQPNRTGRTSMKDGSQDVLDDNNLGDSYPQTQPLDAFWSLNQTDVEKKCGVARIFCIKHRDGESRFSFPVQFDPKTLEFKEINDRLYHSILSSHREEVSKEATLENKILNPKTKNPRFKDDELGPENAEMPKV